MRPAWPRGPNGNVMSNAAALTRPAADPEGRLPRSALGSILLGGFIGGTCDILYATTYWALHGVAASRVLQSVASGVLGRPSFEGGTATAVLGLALHYLIALIFAAFYVLLSRRLTVLVRRFVLCGGLYGCGIFWVMNLIVLPLSAFPRKVSFTLVPVVMELLVHIFLVGVPIAWAARRSAPAPAAAT